MCCGSWGCKESDTTEQLNWTELNWHRINTFIQVLLCKETTKYKWGSLLKSTNSRLQFSLVQSLSQVQLCDPMDCSMQGFPVLHYLPDLLKFMSIELVMPSNQLIFYWPLLLLLSIVPSISAFSSELKLCARWPKYWGFSFSISPSNEYSGWIFFRTDWFDLLAVQGPLKSFLQHHSLKASILLTLKPSLWSNSHTFTWLLEKL